MTKYITKVGNIIKKSLLHRKKYVSGSYIANVNNGAIQLWHYGTLIFQANRETGKIERLGGWSLSDRNSISTAMHVIGTRYTDVSHSSKYKNNPEMGGWYLI